MAFNLVLFMLYFANNEYRPPEIGIFNASRESQGFFDAGIFNFDAAAKAVFA